MIHPLSQDSEYCRVYNASSSGRGSMAVEGFLGEVLALLEDIVVEIRQYRTIETDRIFYQQNHLYACFWLDAC